MGVSMNGKRREPDESGRVWPVEPGDYFRRDTPRGAEWYGMAPNGLMCNITGHQITEHEDKTITVSPSILVKGGEGGEWHGYLERGVWREC